MTRDQLGGTYPTAAFPINASNQSLKVSVDDSRRYVANDLSAFS